MINDAAWQHRSDQWVLATEIARLSKEKIKSVQDKNPTFLPHKNTSKQNEQGKEKQQGK